MQGKSISNSPIVSEKRNVINKLLCPYLNCSKMYSKPCLLRTHILSHENIKPFVCAETDCNKRYLRLCHLLRHRTSHDSKISYDCQKKQVVNSNKALSINDSIIKENQCQTELVPNKLSSNSTITKRIESTEINNLFTNRKANKNGRKSIRSQNRVNLSKSPTKGNNRETKFPCTKCQRDFSTLSNLKQHLPLHSETRVLFTCTHPGCGKAYARKSNLKVHVTTSHDEFSRFHCTYPGCAKIFKFNSTLKKHNTKHINPVEQKKPRRYVRPLASQISGYRTLILAQT